MNNEFYYFSSLKIKLDENVYKPAEDTTLVLDNLPDVTDKVVLEIGAGTGIVSIFCARKAKKVFSTDINPNAIELIKKNIKLNKKEIKTNLIVRQGFLFSPIQKDEKFDFIIFNPPYLPSEKNRVKNESWLEKSWEGGINGYEITIEFLTHVRKYLTKTGKFFLISSTRTGLDKIMKKSEEEKISLEELSSIKFPFEIIYFFKGEIIN
ncbi:MAG: HemK2/MTQ2 family protein methyltransferase [Candidatus Ranarchaeia archaeon]